MFVGRSYIEALFVTQRTNGRQVRIEVIKNSTGAFSRCVFRVQLNLKHCFCFRKYMCMQDACTSCCAIMLPGRKSGFRVGYGPDSNREALKIGPPAGRRPARGPIWRCSRLQSARNLARKFDFRPGSTIAYHRVCVRACTYYMVEGSGPKLHRGVLEDHGCA